MLGSSANLFYIEKYLLLLPETYVLGVDWSAEHSYIN